MLKKTGLILLALTLAAGMVFVGCGGGSSGGDPELLWKLSTDTGFLGLSNGATQTQIGNAIRSDGAIRGAGEDDNLSIVSNKLTVTVDADWGGGIDFTNAGFAYREGDYLVVKGSIGSAGDAANIVLNAGNTGAVATASGAAGAFTLTGTGLTAAQLAVIKNPKTAAPDYQYNAIRLRPSGGTNEGEDLVITIDEVEHWGIR